jgi:hypothetical protein
MSKQQLSDLVTILAMGVVYAAAVGTVLRFILG